LQGKKKKLIAVFLSYEVILCSVSQYLHVFEVGKTEMLNMTTRSRAAKKRAHVVELNEPVLKKSDQAQ
jgi:hypothetical protein